MRTNGTGLRSFIADILADDDKGLLVDAVLIYRTKPDPSDLTQPQAEDSDFILRQYWFGDTSTIACLGLIAYMEHKIAAYIEDNG